MALSYFNIWDVSKLLNKYYFLDIQIVSIFFTTVKNTAIILYVHKFLVFCNKFFEELFIRSKFLNILEFYLL